MIKSTSHRRIRLAIGIRVIESFGETRSFFFASILNPNVQEFKAQKKRLPIEQALTIRNFKQHPPATKAHNQHKEEKLYLSLFKNKINEV
ncbi:hypothetical protein APF67_00145 [Vibrio parahaemolyticus]|nr:hypothetical protein APF67_00145 [Vibrio parahaemolyticus]